MIPDPFVQSQMDALLQHMLRDAAARAHWKTQALAFAETADIYSNAERAADLIQKGAR